MQQEKGNTDLKRQMKQLGCVHFDHREVSLQEAVVRATGIQLKQCSRYVVFISTDETLLNLSKPLKEIKTEAKSDNNSEDIWEPEKHYMTLLKLYPPHRTDKNLKPQNYST
jgi:hypothetical protein